LNSQHLLPEKLPNRLYLAKAINIPTRYSYILHNPRKTVSLIRTAWIRYGRYKKAKTKVTKSDQLIQKLSEEGLDIWILNTDDLSSEEISYFDFIFLEHPGGTNISIKTALQQLRQQEPPGKSAPLVVLADDPLNEYSIDLIEAGADELFLTSVDNKVILARCRALLGRCYQIL